MTAKRKAAKSKPRTVARYPTADDIRACLMKRIDLHVRRTGEPISAIGKAVTGDTALIFAIRDGRNFMIETYQRIHDWLDKHTPADEVPLPKKLRNGSRQATVDA